MIINEFPSLKAGAKMFIWKGLTTAMSGLLIIGCISVLFLFLLFLPLPPKLQKQEAPRGRQNKTHTHSPGVLCSETPGVRQSVTLR